METQELNANVRVLGKGKTRGLRREGFVPAILYGAKIEPAPLFVNARELEKALKKVKYSQALFTLAVQNGQTSSHTVMIRELQKHPVSRKPIHIDFFEVDLARKIRVKVPVVLKGKAIGVEMGGMLQIIRRELEILCLPGEIPEQIEIDVTDLNVGEAIHVKSIVAPDNIEIPADVDFTVVTVLIAKKETEGEAATEEGGEASGAKK